MRHFCFGLNLLNLDYRLVLQWHQLVDAADWVVLDAFQHPSKSGLWVHVVEFAGLDQIIGDGG